MQLGNNHHQTTIKCSRYEESDFLEMQLENNPHWATIKCSRYEESDFLRLLNFIKLPHNILRLWRLTFNFKDFNDTRQEKSFSHNPQKQQQTTTKAATKTQLETQNPTCVQGLGGKEYFFDFLLLLLMQIIVFLPPDSLQISAGRPLDFKLFLCVSACY